MPAFPHPRLRLPQWVHLRPPRLLRFALHPPSSAWAPGEAASLSARGGRGVAGVTAPGSTRVLHGLLLAAPVSLSLRQSWTKSLRLCT